MGTNLLATVADSVDPTWIGAMLYTYAVQFVAWSLTLLVVGFLLGFMWEKRKIDIDRAESDLMKTQHDIDVRTMKSTQEANKELLEFNKKLIGELSEVRKSLSRSLEDNKKLLDLTESTHKKNKQLLDELKENKRNEIKE